MREPFVHFLVVAAAWLVTLGACGRTAPLVEDGYGYAAAAADEGDGTGGTRTGGSSGSSNGGTRTGGTSSGGSSNGGASSGNGGSIANGGTTIDDGGATFSGGTAGNVSVGGSDVSSGGAFPNGGSAPVTGGVSGVGADGGTSAGSFPTTGGASNPTGGTGATGGGTMTTGGTSGGIAGMGTGGTMVMPPGGITCGDASCDPETSVCCLRRSQPSTCEAPGTDCQGGVTLTCSGVASCDPGEICCYHARFSGCQATCDVSVGSPGNPPTIVLCDTSAECGEGETCVLSPRGLAYCGEIL